MFLVSGSLLPTLLLACFFGVKNEQKDSHRQPLWAISIISFKTLVTHFAKEKGEIVGKFLSSLLGCILQLCLSLHSLLSSLKQSILQCDLNG